MSVQIGEKYISNSGEECTIKEIINCNKILVQFTETAFEKYCRSCHLESGAFKDTSKYNLKGRVFKTKTSGNLTVIEDVTKTRKRVKFLETGYECLCYTSNITSGEVKDRLLPSVGGIGYLGIGNYTAGDTSYCLWVSMIKRCTFLTSTNSNRTYITKGVRIGEEWHNFQNFAGWYHNYLMEYKIPPTLDGWDLDKDILGTGLIYGPEFCCIVPREVNQLYKDISNSKGWKYNNKSSKRFTCSVSGRWVKDYSTLEECTYNYGQIKLKTLLNLKEIYQDTTDPKVWENTERLIVNRFLK
jgi:hypothetical protein